MRLKAGIVAGAVALAITAVPAQAATTRAEYVAQVDPICQAAKPAKVKARKAAAKNLRRLVRQLRAGNEKKAIKLSGKAARNLNRFNRIQANLTTQIAPVPPAPRDLTTVSQWLQDRREAEKLGFGAARALKRHKGKKFLRKFRASVIAGAEARDRVKNFGFRYCA
jgi:hypothetical protein